MFTVLNPCLAQETTGGQNLPRKMKRKRIVPQGGFKLQVERLHLEIPPKTALLGSSGIIALALIIQNWSLLSVAIERIIQK